MIEIKKYIEVYEIAGDTYCDSPLDKWRDTFDGSEHYTEVDKTKVVSLPDIQNATNLEKLEWVLRDIGVKYEIKGVWLQGFSNGIKFSFSFDDNGKIIK